MRTFRIVLANQLLTLLLLGLVVAPLVWAGVPGNVKAFMTTVATNCTVDVTTGQLSCPKLGVFCAGGAANDCFITFLDNTGDPAAPASGTRFYFKGGELYKRDSGDGAGVLIQ